MARIQELDLALSHAIGQSRKLAEREPDSAAFYASLEEVEALHQKLRSLRALARQLNQMLPAPEIRLVPPPPRRITPRRVQRGRSWARVMRMHAVRRTPTPSEP